MIVLSSFDRIGGIEPVGGVVAFAILAGMVASFAAGPRASGARPSVAAWLRFGVTALLGLALDLWSKHWAFHTLRQGERMEIIPHVLEFQTMLNKGALFGIGAGQTTLFLVASAAALVLVGWMFLQTPAQRGLLQVALGGILAGALGNMYDRVNVRLADRPERSPRGGVFMQVVGQTPRGYELEEYPTGRGGERIVVREAPNEVGFVRDFIKIPTKWWSTEQDIWPWVFNVADMLLVGGVSILAVYLWFDRKRPEASAPPPAAADGTAHGG